MNKIIKALKALPSQQIERLRILLREKPSKNNSQQIISSLLSYTGLDLLLSNLNSDELKVLNIVSRAENGITFGEIEKFVEINTDHVEELAKNLSEKLLVYVYKNRQKLHNRLDKAYIIPEIGEFLNPLEENTISDYFKGIKSRLNKKNRKKAEISESVWKDANVKKIINFIFKSGGLVTLLDSKKVIPSKSLEKTLSNLLESGIIRIYHDIGSSYKTYILMSEDIFVELSQNEERNDPENKNLNVNNQYMFLLNIFNIYDTISTYGLFLTKQKEYRKIDLQRLAESMYNVYDTDGSVVNSEELVKICLFVMNNLGLLSIKIDSVNVSLKIIEKELGDPYSLLDLILNNIQQTGVDNKLFEPPSEIPNYREIQSIIKIINKNTENPYSYLKLVRLLKPLSEIQKKDLKDIPDIFKEYGSRFKIIMSILCIIGIIEISEGYIILSEIGKAIAERIQKPKVKDKLPDINKAEDRKKIYINPDFTLVIPKQEIPAQVLYHILTHTELIKDDVILNARITKESILKAFKRGMKLSPFLNNLKEYSKIELPQNLEFMINEWSSQTIKIDISNVTILNSSHPSFIDDISFSEFKECIIERLTPNYIIINRKYIDKIVKLAKKRDVVITLFDENK